jgi:hypothetical protein
MTTGPTITMQPRLGTTDDGDLYLCGLAQGIVANEKRRHPDAKNVRPMQTSSTAVKYATMCTCVSTYALCVCIHADAIATDGN